MANEGNIGVSATLSTKDIEKSIDKIVKAVEEGTTRIATSVDKMVDKMENGFVNVAKSTDSVVEKLNNSISKIGGNNNSIDSLAESLNRVGKSKDFDKLSEDAKRAFKETKTLADEIEVLKKKMSEIPVGKRSSVAPMTTEQAVNISKTDVSRLNLPQLQEFVREATKAKKVLTDTKDLDAFKNVSLSAEQAKIKIKALNDEIARQAKKTQITPEIAFGMSENSISERIKKISALKQVQANLSKEDADYEQQLKRTNKALFDLNEANKKAMSSGINLENQQKKMGITMEALTRRMAYYFSVGAITNFAKNLVNIRGEFELQNKSLAAIIQNKDEADRLFARITALAVQSPFQLVELVSYTKQLAAYRIETEKLYDTTKMLADVSAGLGVDMNRLILAYGQVKSAAVLRGQELRQFTEAGIPIIDQLAKKFSEVEGRAVSAGEVFEKVSNRMVSFKMVDEIFKDMTQSGGIFYNMQELQAETLKGKVSNLVDAYQVMLNKIGEGNEGALKGGVDALRYVLENYEDFINILKTLIITFGVYKTISMGLSKSNISMASSVEDINTAFKGLNTKMATSTLFGMSNAMKMAKVAAIGFVTSIKTLGASLLSFLPYAIIFAVAELGRNLYNSATEASKLKKELDGFASSGILQAEQLSNKFKILADKAQNAAEGSVAQNDALRKLQTTYKDILPAQALTLEGLRNMTDGYASVTEAIYTKIKAQQEEAGVTFISTELEPKVKDSYSEFKESLIDIGNEADATSEALLLFRSRIESGDLKLENVYKGTEALEAFSKIYNELTGKGLSIETGGFFSKDSNELANKYLSTILKVKNATSDLTKTLDTSFSNFSQYTAAFKEAQESATKIGMDAAKELQDKGKTKFEVDRAKLNAEREYLINWAAELGVATREQINKSLSEGTPLNVNNVAFLNLFNSIKKQVATTEEKLSGLPRIAADIINRMNNLSGEVKLDFISQLEGKSFGEFISSLQSNIITYDKAIQEHTRTLAVATKGSYAYMQAELFLDEIQKKRTNTLDLLNALNQPTKKERETKKDVQLERVKKQIALINDLRSEYEKLTKAGYTAVESQKILNNQFGKQMTAILPKLDIKQVAGSTQSQAAEIVRGLEKGIKSEAAKLEIDATVSKFTLSAAVELKMDLNQAIEDELSKIQQDYEIGVEIEGMGEMGSLFAEMFDYNPATLEQTITRINEKLSEIGKGIDVSQVDFKDFISTINIPEDSQLYKDVKAYYDFRDKIQQDDFKKTIGWQKQLLEKYSEFEYKRKEIDRKSQEETEALDRVFANKKDSQEYKRYKAAIERKKEEDKSKLAFEEFKSTDEWIKAFEDLDRISTYSIKSMISKLKEFKNSQKDFSPTEMREYANTLKKLEDKLLDRKPFETFSSSVKKLRNTQKNISKETGGFSGTNSQLEESQKKKILAAEETIAKLQKDGGEYADYRIKANENIIKQAQKILFLLEEEKSARVAIGNSLININGYLQQGLAFASDIGNTLFGEQDTEGKEIFNDVITSIEGVGEAAGGLGKIMTGDVVGGVISMVQGVWKTVSTWFDNKNKRINRSIKDSQQEVNRLKIAYTQLERAVDKALGTEETAAKKALIANLELQKAEIERQIELENSRSNKDRDQEAIDNLGQQLNDINNKISDTTDDIVNDLLGSDLKGAAESFADAFISAWKEGEDAMDALSEKFDDMIQNMIVKSLASKIVSKRLKSIFDKVDEATKDTSEGGSELTKSEIKQIGDAGKGIVGSINKDLVNLMKELGIGFASGAKETLTGLQKGISGITEPQAAALESVFNSVLYQSFIQSNLLTNINIHIENNSTNTSQMLLIAQSSHQILQSIKMWTESITGNGHTRFGGAFIKVEI